MRFFFVLNHLFRTAVTVASQQFRPQASNTYRSVASLSDLLLTFSNKLFKLINCTFIGSGVVVVRSWIDGCDTFLCLKQKIMMKAMCCHSSIIYEYVQCAFNVDKRSQINFSFACGKFMIQSQITELHLLWIFKMNETKHE